MPNRAPTMLPSQDDTCDEDEPSCRAIAGWDFDQGLNVKIVIMNNEHWGLMRRQQHLFYGQRYHVVRCVEGVDFVRIAEGFGLPGADLGRAADPAAALTRALAEPGPCMINAPIAADTLVLPMVPPGAANREMIA